MKHVDIVGMLLDNFAVELAEIYNVYSYGTYWLIVFIIK